MTAWIGSSWRQMSRASCWFRVIVPVCILLTLVDEPSGMCGATYASAPKIVRSIDLIQVQYKFC